MLRILVVNWGARLSLYDHFDRTNVNQRVSGGFPFGKGCEETRHAPAALFRATSLSWNLKRLDVPHSDPKRILRKQPELRLELVAAPHVWLHQGI